MKENQSKKKTEAGRIGGLAKVAKGFAKNPVSLAKAIRASAKTRKATAAKRRKLADYQSALDRLEIATTALKVIADPKADLPTDGRETCRIYEDMALEALTRINGFNPTVDHRPTGKGEKL